MAHGGGDAPVEFFFAILEGDDQDAHRCQTRSPVSDPANRQR